MASGVEEIMAVLDEIKSEVMANPCNMGDMYPKMWNGYT